MSRNIAIGAMLVLVRVGGDTLDPELRPALVVRRGAGGGVINAVVFLDERDPGTPLVGEIGRVGQAVRRCQSLTCGDDVGQWRHWDDETDNEAPPVAAGGA